MRRTLRSGRRHHPVVVAAWVAIPVLFGAIMLESCAVAPSESVCDHADTALGIVGRSACELSKDLPGISTAVDAVDSANREAYKRRQQVEDRRKAGQRKALRERVCAANPDHPLCAAIIEDAFGAASGTMTGSKPVEGGSTPSGPARTLQGATALRERIKRAEGGFRYEVYDVFGSPHVCAGHSIAANKDAQRFTGNIDEALCDRVLDEDIEMAQIKARKHLGCQNHDCIETCYLMGCGGFDGIPDAVAALRERNTNRSRALAAALEDQ